MASEIRIGKISSIDYDRGTVCVVYHDKDDSVTSPIPLLSDEYNMPQVGTQVLVLHLSNGSEAGIVMGSPWSERNKPPESGKGLYRKDLDKTIGKATIRYQDGTITFKADTIEVKGNLNVIGDLVVTGSVEASGDVVAGGISLRNHTHSCTCSLSSGNTAQPR